MMGSNYHVAAETRLPKVWLFDEHTHCPRCGHAIPWLEWYRDTGPPLCKYCETIEEVSE